MPYAVSRQFQSSAPDLVFHATNSKRKVLGNFVLGSLFAITGDLSLKKGAA